jgi:hypothetical protein
MRVKIATALSAGVLALITACSGNDNSASPSTSTESTPASKATSEPSSESAEPAGECPVGEYEVTKITGKSGADVQGQRLVATSGGGLKLALDNDGTWTLTGDGAKVKLTAAGVTVTATVDGSAEGSYAKAGNEYAFKQEGATGKVTLDKDVAGTSSLPMSDVGPALAPSGTATLTCGPGTLTVSSESVDLELKQTGGPGGTGGGTGGTGGGTGGGGTLTINDSAQSQIVDCAGRDVVISGSTNKLTFTGSCGTVSINGSRNEVTLAKVGAIRVNGSFNKVTWSDGNPATSNNGTGNSISQN